MNCNKLIVASVVFATVLGWAFHLSAGTKPVNGKSAATGVRPSRTAKAGENAAAPNTRVANRKSKQYIVKLMKEMRIPEVSFKPPATIVDAVEFFRGVSKDCDRADIPIENRGFNFILKCNADRMAVPPIAVSDISFYEALRLVCESAGYIFSVNDSSIVISSVASDEMERRSYSIKPEFVKVLDSLRNVGIGVKGLEDVFSDLGGVCWPDGSHAAYVRSASRLMVENTYENLSRLERVLAAFGATRSPLAQPSRPLSNSQAERSVVKRMKQMRIPEVSFKPPATIVDAVEFFRVASKTCDRAEAPIGKRGFNFVLKSPAGNAAWPVIPALSASDINFYEALKLVCESVEFKFTVKGDIVFVGSADSDEIEFRTYKIRDSFLRSTTMANSRRGVARRDADDDVAPFDWHVLKEQMGVKWPNGSRLFFVKSANKLFVGNTAENLSVLENALKEMKVIQQN